MGLKIALLIIALMISVQVVAGSSSIGIGVSPGNMSFKLAPATSEDQSLYVMNTGNETAAYEIFVDGNTYDDWFTFSSTSFDLNAGEIREVKVTLSVPATAETDVECKIKIPCTVSGKVVRTGVIIPVHIEISTSEESYSGGTSGTSSSGGGRSSPEFSTSEKVREKSQQLIVNASNLVAGSRQDITSAGEKLRTSAETLEETANRSLDDATSDLDKVTRKLDDTTRKIEDTKEKKFEDTKKRIEDTKKRIEDTKEKKFEDLNTIFEDIIQYIDSITKNLRSKYLSLI